MIGGKIIIIPLLQSPETPILGLQQWKYALQSPHEVLTTDKTLSNSLTLLFKFVSDSFPNKSKKDIKSSFDNIFF